MNVTTGLLMQEKFRIERVAMGATVTSDVDYDTIHGFDHLEEIEFEEFWTDPSTNKIDDSDVIIKYTLYKNDLICDKLELVNIEDIVEYLREYFKAEE